MKVNTAQYTLLYSLYFYPSIIIAPVGGLLIDRVFGVRIALSFFLVLCLIGQIIWAIGGFVNHFSIMLLGRLIAGAGGSMTLICLGIYVGICFIGKINTINGILLGAGRLGAAIAVNLNNVFYTHMTVQISTHVRLGFVLLIGAGLLFLGLIASLILGYLYSRANYTAISKTNLVRCQDLYKLPLSYWLIVFVAATFYVAILSPVSIGELYYIHKYGVTLTMANLINGIIYFFPIFLCPLFGFIIDRVGFNLIWILVSVSLGVFHHFFLAFSGNKTAIAYIASFSGGIAYSMFTISLWPMVALIVKPEQLGTGYGVQGSIINIVQVSIIASIGLIAESYGYFMVQLFYGGLSCMGLAFIIIMNLVDATQPKFCQLNISGRKRRELRKVNCKPAVIKSLRSIQDDKPYE